jgi:hypothetical protein
MATPSSNPERTLGIANLGLTDLYDLADDPYRREDLEVEFSRR